MTVEAVDEDAIEVAVLPTTASFFIQRSVCMLRNKRTKNGTVSAALALKGLTLLANNKTRACRRKEVKF